jgi:hypothetical protein
MRTLRARPPRQGTVLGALTKLCTLGVSRTGYSAEVQQRPLTTASRPDRQRTKQAGTTTRRPGAPLVRDEEARARCVPDGRSTRGYSRSPAGRRSRSPHVAESPGSRQAAPQTSQADGPATSPAPVPHLPGASPASDRAFGWRPGQPVMILWPDLPARTSMLLRAAAPRPKHHAAAARSG